MAAGDSMAGVSATMRADLYDPAVRRAPNQPHRMADHNAFERDPSLRYWLARLTGGDVESEARALRVGAQVGGHRLQDAADIANRHLPELEPFDRYGNRVDLVRFDDSWHELIGAIVGSGVCGMPWTLATHGYVTRAALTEMWARLDMGAFCPVSMTTAALAVLDGVADLATEDVWFDRLANNEHTCTMAGMAMTEPQGGSDVGLASTVALDRGDGTFALTGHKWFVSYPMADVLLVLAREPQLGEGSRGLSCFLVEGWLPDGARNGIELHRLKDKLGTRSLPSAEVMLRDAVATRIGEPGAGVRTIMSMVTHTRLDCAVGSTGLMTRALTEAVSHTSQRMAFGRLLVDQPLMRQVLADMALEREGALALAMEVARSFAEDDPLARLLPPVAKYWITRRGVDVAIEASEVLGGNGYVEEFVTARLFRDAQVNSTWEGSGNVMVLDWFRALKGEPELAGHLTRRVERLLADDPTGRADFVRDELEQAMVPAAEHEGRRAVGRIAVALEAALLVSRAADTGDEADAIVARAFVDTRIGGGHGERVFGAAGDELAGAAEVLIERLRMG